MSEERIPVPLGQEASSANAQEECYAGLPLEVCERLEQRATCIQTILTRDVLDIGRELASVREEYRHNHHGGFEHWVQKKTAISLATAYNCLDVQKHFGNLVNFTSLDITKSAQYLLAAASTPQASRDQAIERAEAGEKITPTMAKALIEAQQAQRQAEETTHAAQEEVQRTQQRLARMEAETQETISDLTQQLIALHEEINAHPVPEEHRSTVEVVPPEVAATLETLQARVRELTEQRDHLAQKAHQLGADLATLREATYAERERELRTLRLCQHWREITDAFQRNVSKLLGQFPSSLDTQVFEAEEWNRLAHLEMVAQRFLTECGKLREAPRQVVVEAE